MRTEAGNAQAGLLLDFADDSLVRQLVWRDLAARAVQTPGSNAPDWPPLEEDFPAATDVAEGRRGDVWPRPTRFRFRKRR